MLPEPEPPCAPPAATPATAASPDTANRTPLIGAERHRQPEPAHHAVVDKPSNRRDPLPFEGQHYHPVPAEHRVVLVCYVEPVRGLPVRAGGDQPVRAVPAPGTGGPQAPADRRWPLVLQCHRRH